MRVLDLLIKQISSASRFNSDIEVAPACVLWTDKDRQWEGAIPLLQADLPELVCLGVYAPEKRTGPAIWLRCLLAGTTDDFSLPEDRIPVLYLPGVSRQDLRAIESCPDHLKPLAELQYRGAIWSQVNAKDWTILAFLKSDQGGLGLDVSQDNDAKNAMQLALTRLLDEDLTLLQGKRLDRDYFNTLLTGGDPVRDLLQWLDQGDAFKDCRGDAEWKAFLSVCKSTLAFDPQNDGILEGVKRLATQEGPWRAAWERFCEAPKRYPSIPTRLRQCPMPPVDLLSDAQTHGGWIQWNEEQEDSLRTDLRALDKVTPAEGRKRILTLEQSHGVRRRLVWSELGFAPLANSLEHLATLARVTQISIAAGTPMDMATAYQHQGWLADDAVLRALAAGESTGDLAAITVVIRAIYLPWAEQSARHLQHAVDGKTYPGGTCLTAAKSVYQEGDCILFVDGLRFDVGKRLQERLEQEGMTVTDTPCWTALPSVTATGKPAVTPVRDKIRGLESNMDFEPGVLETGQSLKGGYHLKKLLTDGGWTILERTEPGNGTGRAWCAFGDIDHEGHDRGTKLARHLDGLLAEISDRIRGLLAAGWKRVFVVTDHGWLLMPGGLPKVELPAALTEHKWGRCASVKPGSSTDERLFPWYWEPNQHFALADGISCFKQGEEYAHGGLSLQECLTLQLEVVAPGGTAMQGRIELTDIVWKGLRCTVAVDGDVKGLSLDLRTQAGNASSSVVLNRKPMKENGTGSVVVENEDLEGQDVVVVLVDENGALRAQANTVIGKDLS